MEIAVKILNEKLSLQFVINLLQESQSVKIGLAGQYFIAYELLEDIDAKIIHAKKFMPDIILSDTKFIDKLIKNTKSNIVSTKDLEIKTFRWNYSSFSGVLRSYFKRRQTDNLFIGISSIFLCKSNKSVTFNNLEECNINVVVIMMESLVNDKIENKLIWKEIVSLTEKQIPEGQEIHELPLDKILEIVNFKRHDAIDKRLKKQEEFNEKQDEFNEKQEEFNEEIKNIVLDLNHKIDTLIKLLKEDK